MKKKFGLILSTVMASSLFLTACGDSTNNTANNTKSTEAPKSTEVAKSGDATGKKDPVTIRFATWDTGDSLKYQQDIAKAFEAKNPDIKVQVEAYGDGFDDKLAASFGAQNPPDVTYMWDYPKYSKTLEPLDTFVKNDPEMGKLVGDFYQGILNYHKYNGATYGLPVGFTTRVMYYNKKLFDEAGVSYPKNGWTWDDFKASAVKLSNKDKKQYAFARATKDNGYAFQEFVWSNGGALISPDGKKLEGFMNSKETVEAIQLFGDLVNSNVMATMENGDKVSDAFKAGKVAMVESGIWPLEGFKKAGIDIGTVTIPAFGSKPVKGVIHSAGVAMTKDSKHKDLAWRFIKYYADADAAKMRKADLPIIKAVVTELKTQEDPLIKPFYAMLENSSDVPSFLIRENWGEIDKNLDFAIGAVLLKTTTAERALNDAVKKSEQLLK
ncbi:extracellular solute-binding protein [Paenibacillus sp. GCM10027628]|uniref:ABC transporter substrate-binding protein n=1 Tax=Paenibacillus sp. GCM10027628 TaxID=3273413 RepID=UPI00363DBAB3